MAWYSHLFQNFPQLIVIHTVKGFGIVNKAEIDALLELTCFFHDPVVGIKLTGPKIKKRLPFPVLLLMRNPEIYFEVSTLKSCFKCDKVLR